MGATKGDIKLLEEVERKLQALTDTSDGSSCAVAVEHKEAVRLYVDTWVTPIVGDLLAHLRDGVPIPRYRLDGGFDQ